MAKKSKNPGFDTVMDEAELTELAMNLIDAFELPQVASLLGHSHGKLNDLRNRCKVLYLARQIRDEELLEVAANVSSN